MRDILTYILIKLIIIKGNFDLWRLNRSSINARKKNDALLLKIIKNNKDTEYGKKYNFANIKTIEDYRNNVPFSNYDDYKDYILRMITDGEKDLITHNSIVGYVRTSGSTGQFKDFPMTKPGVKVYTRYTLTTMMALADKWCKEKYGHGLKPGRGIFKVPAMDFELPNGKTCSNMVQISSDRLSFIYPYLVTIPYTRMVFSQDINLNYINLRLGLEDRNLAFIFCVFISDFHDMLMYLKENWKTLTDDIEKGSISDISKATLEAKERLLKHLKPNPKRAKELREEFEKGFNEDIVNRVWPNLSVIYGIYNGIYAPFINNIKKMTKDIPFDNSIYGASEGLIGVTDELNTDRRLLLSESLYYEFIPLEDQNKILSLDELELGKEYEIVITNQAGLYRYRINDVIKVESYINDCPYILFSYRKGNVLSVCGEKTTEGHIKNLIEAIEKESGCESIKWVATVDINNRPPRYLLLLENKEGKDLSKYEDLADEDLRKTNIRYVYVQESNMLGSVKIVNLEVGTHELWKEKMLKKGTSQTQIKPVTVLDNDEKKKFFLSHIKSIK